MTAPGAPVGAAMPGSWAVVVTAHWERTKCPPRGVKHVSLTECACGHQKAIAPRPPEGGGNHDDRQLCPESKRGPCEA